MKKGLLIYLFVIMSCTTNAFAADFTVCKSTYALCTTALCKPVANKPGMVACECNVKTGYSAGTKQCQDVQNTPAGKLVLSRYYPIKSYVVCSNTRPWAWCLDSPCIIDKKNPSRASCLCSIKENKGDYIIVTDKYTKNTCTTGLYSSATVADVNQVTDFLKTQKDITPQPIKVIKSGK